MSDKILWHNIYKIFQEDTVIVKTGYKYDKELLILYIKNFQPATYKIKFRYHRSDAYMIRTWNDDNSKLKFIIGNNMFAIVFGNDTVGISIVYKQSDLTIYTSEGEDGTVTIRDGGEITYYPQLDIDQVKNIFIYFLQWS